MANIILESRENYRNYIRDLSRYVDLRDYKIYSTIRDMEKHITVPAKINNVIIIVSNMFLAERTIKLIEMKLETNINKPIIILDYDHKIAKDFTMYKIMKSSAIVNYIYADIPIMDSNTLHKYLEEEGKFLSSL